VCGTIRKLKGRTRNTASISLWQSNMDSGPPKKKIKKNKKNKKNLKNQQQQQTNKL
jgi:hypothetical protein